MANKKTKTVKKKGKAAEEQTRREIAGVCLVALAIFLAAGIYTDMVGVLGAAIRDFCYGMLGVAAYIAPVVVAALGVLYIVLSGSSSSGSTIIMITLGIVCILVMIHTAVRGSIESSKVIDYFKDAYSYGRLYHKGGGLIGGLLAYPSMLLLGSAGTYIFFGAALLILFLIATRLSLRAMGERVGASLKTGVDTVSDKVHQARELRATRSAEAESSSSGKKLFAMDLSHEDITPRKKRGSKQAGQQVVRRREEPAEEIPYIKSKKDWDGDISYLPDTGRIPRKRQDDDPFDILAEVEPKELRPDYQPETAQPPFDMDETHAAEDSTIFSQSDESDADMRDYEQEPLPDDVEAPASNPEPPEYRFPPYSCLKEPDKKTLKGTEMSKALGDKLVETLASFNIKANLLSYSVGPVITRYELQPAQGVRVNRITSLSDDIALALAAPRVRIEAPIPGKSAIGIEIPNKETVPVLLREVLESTEFKQGGGSLRFGLGKDIAGKVICADLDKMPHLLIAGSTGSGKSVCINDIILSFIYSKKPKDLKLIMVDPKKVELRVYSGLPHLFTSVVTDPKKAANALKWAVTEMDQRYLKMSQINARDLNRYNALQQEEADKLPRLVIIIDELADLMMVAAKDVEESICRIAQLGRAAGIHLIVATQRPSADIITGLIKANIPSRIALAVSSSIDSRVIMDTSGAEKLLGRGDMLFHANGASKPIRAQAAFVNDEEVEAVMNFIKAQPNDAISDIVEIPDIISDATAAVAGQGNGKQEDDLLDDAVKILLDSGNGTASISMIQRRLRVGYARAARLIDIMEQLHVVSGFDGSKSRKLLVGSFEEYRRLMDGDEGEE